MSTRGLLKEKAWIPRHLALPVHRAPMWYGEMGCPSAGRETVGGPRKGQEKPAPSQAKAISATVE